MRGTCDHLRFNQEKLPDTLDKLVSSITVAERLVESVATALELVLNQTMTMSCNLLLARRDALLQGCPKLSTEDTTLLRTAHFTDGDVFPTQGINQAEDNYLKRRSSSSRTSAPAKKPRREHSDSRGQSFQQNAPSYHNRAGAQSQPFRGRRKSYSSPGQRK